jgi:parvulin-like peptidyl-prolyl isomerase
LAQKLHLDEDIANSIRQQTREFLIQKLLEQKLDRGDVTMAEEEIKAYYKRHSKDFILEQPTIRAQQILVKDNQTAWQIKRMLRKGERFGDLARRYSLDPSAELEGDMGFITEWDLDPQLGRRCLRLNKNEVSNPIKTHSGYHIIKVLDKRGKGDVKPLTMVREKIINNLTKQKKKEALESLIRELKRKYPITMDLSILEQSQPSPPPREADDQSAAPETPATDAQDKY